MSQEWDDAYADYLVQSGADKIEIPEERMAQIMAKLDELASLSGLVGRVKAILERMAKSGRYAHIAYDAHAGQYVLIRTDGSRTAHAPEQLDRLFHARAA